MLFNEWIAEQQSAYLIFFVALAGAGFSVTWGQWLLTVAVLIWAPFYIPGVYSTTTHKEKIAQDHKPCMPGCRFKLSKGTHLRIWGTNLVFSIVLAGIAAYLAFHALKEPTQ